MLDITLDKLIALLGNPTRQTGHQYYFRCPACSAGGGDTSGDNLLYNDKKQLLKCFACDDGAKQVLHMLNKKFGSYTPPTEKQQKQYTPWWKANLENLALYMLQAHEEMNVYAEQWLWERHGINKQTIEYCNIGYDDQPFMNIGASVCFPLISLNHNLTLVGFELRQIGSEKIIRHTYDAPRCLCVTYDIDNADCIIITEGHKDSYCLMQLLKEKDQLERFTILTPAHGVNDILHNMEAIDFTRYKHFYLLLDNDKAGDTATQQIIQQYEVFKDMRKTILKGYNDIGEMWMKEYVCN